MTIECDYCNGSKIPGIHIPADFDDREECRDGKVFVAACIQCDTFASDEAAAAFLAKRFGWKVRRSMDKKDALDLKERRLAKNQRWFRPYFEITLAEAEAAHGDKK